MENLQSTLSKHIGKIISVSFVKQQAVESGTITLVAADHFVIEVVRTEYTDPRTGGPITETVHKRTVYVPFSAILQFEFPDETTKSTSLQPRR